ncbi:MAG: glycosyltransferase family 4 protein [Hyphomicrobiales bacterium]|nr:glycosyltransferase family 4 protein [Hyphomicrobiales bacterium]
MPNTVRAFRAERPIAGRTVLQIIPSLESGGAERTTLEMAEALVRAGARALVATEGGRLVGELQALGGEFHAFPAATKNPFAMAANVGRLAALIAREGVDLVHARSRAPAWVALGATRRAGVAFVTTYHGVYSANSAIKARYNSVMAMGDRVIANSEFTASHVLERYPFAAGKIVTVHRGVDLRAFSPAAVAPDRVRALREKWRAPADQRIVLMPARLARRKGHRVLIRAARLLRDAGRRDLLFILAGDEERDAFPRELDRFAEEAGVQDIVGRVGHCEDMPAALLSAACVVAPSVAPEAFGRVAVEAQAMGAPVVASDLGAAAETVLCPPACDPAARTGWLVPPDSPEDLAAAIGRALDLGAAAREALALRARARVVERFSVDRMCAATLEVYESLLEPAPAG